MVDAERLALLLRRVLDEVAELQQLAEQAPLDATQLAASKYRFIVAIEASIDAGQHVIASEGLAPADTFAAVFRSLGDAGLVSTDVADDMGAAARFRNLLVHGYAKVDDGRVEVLVGETPARLGAFVQQLSSAFSD